MNSLNKSISRTSRKTTWMLSLVILMSLTSVSVFADGDATIKLSFDVVDSVRYCKAMVMASNKPVSEAEVHFYVKRMYSLLPVGKSATTDSSGSVSVEFLKDLPGDKDGNIIVIAKIEDDDKYGTVETQSTVQWGVKISGEGENGSWGERSLSASRAKAPMVLILVSNAIIFTIWGVIIFVVLQIFKIRKESKILKAKK